MLQEWISKAEQDWQATRQLLTGRPETVPDVIAFHAQQTGEKYLKALLIQAGEEPPPIHDLGALLDLVALHFPAMEEQREDIESLTPFAVRFRYPGSSVGVDQARQAAERAGHIRRAIRAHLGLSRNSPQ